MVQLCILSGKQAGNQTIVRRFPFSIGRSAGSNLCLDDDGVWESHLVLEFEKPEQFVVRAAEGALLAVNQEPVRVAPLRQGDTLSFGSVKLLFCLAPTRQHGLAVRESIAWALLTAATATQLALIYWLVW